jgi:hypothetical protein
MKKNRLSLKNPFCILALLMVATFLHAQKEVTLNSNNISAGIATGGNLFSDSIGATGPLGSDLFEVPKGSGKDMIYTQALWMWALDANDSLHVAANRYSEYGHDYFDGPIAAVYDSIYDRYYKRVFKVTQAQITQFKNLTFPASESQVDSAILFWPGLGNPSVINDYGVNISSPLAPFVDVNNNGIYEPLLGDYPGICGDAGVFFVYNDARALHTESGGTALGVEIRGLASAFIDSSTNLPYAKQAVNNSIFVQYEIENKSPNNYTNFNLGNWNDGDIGCFDNDYVGCDSARNLMFSYNGVALDPDCAPENGYGTLPVCLGIKLLNQPLSVFGYFSGQGAALAAQEDPTTANQYALFLQGYWGDSSAFEYGGNGFHSGGQPTKYMYSGDPTDTSEWSEATVPSVPGDRRMYGATHNLTFNAGEIKHFDYAYYASYDSTSDFLRIVDTVKRDGDILQAFYESNIVPCQSQFTTAIHEVAPEQITVSIYPNPASDQVTIIAGDNIKTLQLMDIQGRILISQTVGAKMFRLPVSNLAKGVYLVNIQCDGGTVVRRIVVE